MRECLAELEKAGWLELVHRESPDGLIEPALDYVVHSEASAARGRSSRSPEEPTVDNFAERAEPVIKRLRALGDLDATVADR